MKGMSSKNKTTAAKEDARRARVPKLRFPEFQSAGDWTTEKLGAVATINTEKVGKNICVPMSITSGVGLVSQEDKFGRVIAGDSYKNYLLLKPNEFAYNKSATKEYSEGFLTLYSGVQLAAVPNSIFTCFRINGDSPDVRFLNYQFSGNLHGRWLRQFIQVGARAHGSLSINDSDLMALPVPVPAGSTSVAEQQKIAECLSSVDELLAAQTRKVDALKAHKKRLMQQIFPREGETQPRLRFPEFQNAWEWEETKLGKHVEIQSGYSPSGYALSSNGEYAFVKVEDLNNCIKYQVSGREFCDDPDGMVPTNSILFPKRGAAIELNKIRITATEILIDTNLMALTPKAGLKVEFLYYYLSNVGLSHIADTSTIPQINNKHIIPFDLRLPVEAEQKRIATCMSSLDDLITAETQKLEALKTHKKGLMQQLFPSAAEPAA